MLASFSSQAGLAGFPKSQRLKTLSSRQDSIKPEKLKSLNKVHAVYRKQGVIPDKDAAIAPLISPNHFEVHGAIGIANIRAKDSLLGVTRSEIDKLVQTNDGHWGTGLQLGLGYVFYRPNALLFPDHIQWLTAIEPQLNLNFIALSSGIRGDVWRFRDPNFKDLSYTMPFSSLRLMADGALTLASLKGFSVYAKGGIGPSWNTIRYQDSENFFTLNPEQFLILDENHRYQFAWEAGGGLTYAFNKKVALSLEYLYANLGRMRVSSTGDTGNITEPLIVPGLFRVNTQSLLLSLRIGF
jgi:opacity protein-like surface antigen